MNPVKVPPTVHAQNIRFGGGLDGVEFDRPLERGDNRLHPSGRSRQVGRVDLVRGIVEIDFH
ncbi:MAG: hypothetical protein QNI97_06755 [Desulfobacterales bacterium]|nr:hypothetical protein [Desulfobacterales bacterium]